MWLRQHLPLISVSDQTYYSDRYELHQVSCIRGHVTEGVMYQFDEVIEDAQLCLKLSDDVPWPQGGNYPHILMMNSMVLTVLNGCQRHTDGISSFMKSCGSLHAVIDLRWGCNANRACKVMIEHKMASLWSFKSLKIQFPYTQLRTQSLSILFHHISIKHSSHVVLQASCPSHTCLPHHYCLECTEPYSPDIISLSRRWSQSRLYMHECGATEVKPPKAEGNALRCVNSNVWVDVDYHMLI